MDDQLECARPRRAVRYAMTAWLGQRAWSWFWTLTCHWFVPLPAVRRFVGRWLREIAKVTQSHVHAAFVIERRRVGQPFDVHLLLELEGATQLDVPAADRSWKAMHAACGFTRGLRYDAARGSVADYMQKIAEVEVTVACPRQPRCRRRSGCVRLRGAPWL